MKRVTVSVTVADSYGFDQRKMKNALAEAALSQTAIQRLDLVSIDFKFGTPRSKP